MRVTALSHCVCFNAAPTRTVLIVVGGSERATCKDIRSWISASVLIRRGLRQPSHGLHGRPHATAQHQRCRWVADRRNPLARKHLRHPTVRWFYTNAPSAFVHLVMSLRSPHVVRDHLSGFGTTAVVSAGSLCQDRILPSCPIVGLLLGLMQSGNTGGATLNTGYLNARASRAWEAHWRLPLCRMTSSGCILGLIMSEWWCLLL